MVIVDDSSKILAEPQPQPQQQQQQQQQQPAKRDNNSFNSDDILRIDNKNLMPTVKNEDLSHDEQEDHEFDDDQSTNKRLRSIDTEDGIRLSKFGKIDNESFNKNQKDDSIKNESNNVGVNENLLLLKKAYAKYTDEIHNIYAPISPALTNSSDKSPLHHHDLMVMHHFNEDHALSLSALSSSSSSLLRTSSNASSSSSTSSSNNINMNINVNETMTGGGNISNSNSSIQSENGQFLIPAANQLMMLNENYKKLISTSSPTTPGENFLADQLALLARSRSSSAESNNNNSTNYQHQQMKNFFQMHNLRGGDLDNVLLSKYLNSVTRAAFNNQKLQQANFLYNSSNQEALVGEMLLKQAQIPKLTKIDEIDSTTKSVAIPTSNNNSLASQMPLMKQMLNQYGTNQNCKFKLKLKKFKKKI